MNALAQLPDRAFTTAEAEALGLNRSTLVHLVRAGDLRRPFRGVYLPQATPDDLVSRCAAVRLVVNTTAVACDRTAAWIWGVDVLDVDELETLPPLETFVLRGRSRTRRDGCDGGVRDLTEARDVVEVEGIRVTTPLRTALDLACNLRRRGGLAALDGFMREHDLRRDQMRRELQRYFRRRGVVQARALVELADPRAESPGESWTRLEIHDRDLPAPTPQVWVYDDQGLPLFRLDLAWRRRKVAAEYDGRDFHGEDRRAHDEERRAWLRRRGWKVVVFRAEDFSGERLDVKMRELRAALG
ncbi:MAG: type IV toxin-antitoxin system AbiEi family antitoxin domain-containing protein [Actinomycetes bacterium]